MTKKCKACGTAFQPHPKVPNQTYCSTPECQRERRRRWLEEKRQVAAIGGVTWRDPATDMLHVNQEFNVSVVIVRCFATEAGNHRWKIRFDTSLRPDITVAVRLNHVNDAVLDYYLLPSLDFGQPRISLADHNAVEFDCYRFDTLDYLYGMAARVRLRRAA